MKQIRELTITALAFAAISAGGAGFDCSKAKSKVEVAICADGNTSALDSELKDIFNYVGSKIRSDGEDRYREFVGIQKTWLLGRDRALQHSGIEGLRKVYRERVAELELKKAVVNGQPYGDRQTYILPVVSDSSAGTPGSALMPFQDTAFVTLRQIGESKLLFKILTAYTPRSGKCYIADTALRTSEGQFEWIEGAALRAKYPRKDACLIRFKFDDGGASIYNTSQSCVDLCGRTYDLLSWDLDVVYLAPYREDLPTRCKEMGPCRRRPHAAPETDR